MYSHEAAASLIIIDTPLTTCEILVLNPINALNPPTLTHINAHGKLFLRIIPIAGAFDAHLSFSMCEKTVSKKIYTCGDEEEQDVTFTTCGDQGKPGHKVTVTPLASSRVKGKCGKANCTNP